MTSERVEEIRAYVTAHPNRTHGPVCLADTLYLLAERDRLAAEVDRVTSERLNVLSELSKVAFKLGTTEAHLDAARVALEEIAKPADEIEKCKDPMDTDEMADAWMRASRRRRDIAREALARLGGGK